ncbi:hypothetical protein V3W47_05095 [Deinococcus sp. YIM 134068]|uniref:hypothetical protein n=1 Tax=Deinococcus lichenicola TaxID=3118910 RepID=UPI002F94519E
MMKTRPLAALLLCLTLCACTPGGVRELRFREGPPDVEVSAARLLTDQIVPQGRLLGLKEAVARAPEGSLILACGARWSPLRPWGICTHVSRKIAPGLLTEAPGLLGVGGGLLDGGPKTIPQERLESRDVVIVLDVGVRPQHLPALRAEAARLDGMPYRVGVVDDPRNGLDCSTYQNALQRAVGLPEVVPRHGEWNLYLPQDALGMPGVRVLWVGVRGRE